MQAFFADLRRTGSIADWYPERMAPLDERSALLRLQDYIDVEQELLHR